MWCALKLYFVIYMIMIPHLQQLLATQDSLISQLLKFNLYGLKETLTQAKTAYPADPGYDLCSQVIGEIDGLLQSNSVGELEDVEFTIHNSTSGQLLTELRQIFNSDLEVRFYLGDQPLHSDNDCDLWNEIHRKLLRLPEDLATIWKNRTLEIAKKLGAMEDYVHLHYLPFVRDEIIYPGLSGTIVSPGLSLSKKALLKLDLAQLHNSDNWHFLTGFLSLYTSFIDIDPDLHHALKSVFSFDVISFQSHPEQKQLYLESFSDRLQRNQKLNDDSSSIINLRSWLDLDEAIHSLVFVPPAERYSWWGKLQQESRRILKKMADQATKAGNNIKIKQLSGLYADICQYAKDDLQLENGGTPGEVLSCLRLYAKINEEEYPGRVIYRAC